MATSVEQFKLLMRVDGNEDDMLIKIYLDAAEQYVHTAVGADDAFFEEEKIQDLLATAIYALAGSYYTYRISVSDVTLTPVDATMNSIIGQMRGRYDYWKVGDVDETN